MNHRIKKRSTIPHVIPLGWETKRIHGQLTLLRDSVSGLRSLYSIDFCAAAGKDPTFMGAGDYRHISFSRQDRYPSWEEMKREILECGLFDRKKDVVMCLPPEGEFVNVHPNCFHWWQKV